MTAADTPSDLDLLNAAIRGRLAAVRTALPAQVIAYDAATQLVQVQPLIRAAYLDADTNELRTQLPPAIPSVPVLWPSAAAGSITFPLAAGDQGFILCAERSIDEWKATGDDDNTPRDLRRFDLSDAVFLPGGRAIPNALDSSAVDATALVIAAAILKLGDSSASDFVALQTLVEGELSKIKTAYDAHTHGGVTTGPGVTGPPVPLIPSLGSVGATKVKAK